MYLKVHQSQAGKIVALCDEDLIGKVLDDGKIFMDLDRFRNFYVGEKVSEIAVKDALKDFNSANIVGRKSIAITLKEGIASKDSILKVGKVPFLQIYHI